MFTENYLDSIFFQTKTNFTRLSLKLPDVSTHTITRPSPTLQVSVSAQSTEPWRPRLCSGVMLCMALCTMASRSARSCQAQDGDSVLR